MVRLFKQVSLPKDEAEGGVEKAEVEVHNCSGLVLVRAASILSSVKEKVIGDKT
jgi:hypothetical protein